MPFLCHLPSGTDVVVDDLPLSAWAAIGDAADSPWYEVMRWPAGHPRGAIALVKACAAYAGEDPPADDWLTGRTILKAFELVDDDLPAVHVNGVPDPKADGPETTGS